MPIGKTARTSSDDTAAPLHPKLREGRVALVTGASGGIGRGIALRLALEGAAVAVHYHRQAREAASVVEEIRSAGGVAKAFRADVCNLKQVQAMVAKIKREFGNPDILVNNAGVMFPADLATFNAAQFEKMRATNVDVGVEWYFAPQSVLSVGVFYKQLNGLTSSVTQHVPFSSLNMWNGSAAPSRSASAVLPLPLVPLAPIFQVGRWPVSASFW